MATGTKICGRCGEPIPLGALGGNCPRCLAALALFTTADSGGAESPALPLNPCPQRFFGDYEILGELARGGMGIVYRARQVSLNRLVALKMIAAGQLASPAQVQRFRLEAEAAARLDHPNIVPIYEVGEHQGQHFYSMKLIAGGTLAEALSCRSRRKEAQTSGPSQSRSGKSEPADVGSYTHEETARLLAKVTRAVHYAHQRGVLHRDLKPTNILIDEQGEPHVTDFGVAKLMGDDGSLTQITSVLGTPAYMAPELAAGKAAATTTAADVYSLGAILYESLAGQPPFVAENVPALLRKIAEEEPTPPVGNDECRMTNGKKPSPAGLRVSRRSCIDLEIICLKCLEKDPARRYPSAQALAEDLERMLAGVPILARSASAAEKVWRWCRRRPAVAALWSALVLVLVLGLTGVLWQWRRAEADKRMATIEAAKSRQLAQFLQQMLTRVGPSASLGRDTTLLREILDQAAGRLGDLTNQPALVAELGDTIGHTYYDVGDYEKAVAMHREAVRQRRQIVGREHLDTAQSVHLLAQALAAHGELNEAEALNQEALAIRVKLLGPQHPKVGDSLNNLGNVYFRRRDLAQALRYFEQALLIYQRFDEGRTAAVLNNMANVLELKPDYAAAEKLYREAVAIARRVHGDSHPTTALYLRNLAESLRGQEKLNEADALHSEALAVRATLLDELHPLLADSFERLALTKSQEEKWAEAETLYRKALGARRQQFPNDPHQWDEDASALANVLNQQQKFEDTDHFLTELLTATRDTDPRAARLRAIRGSTRAQRGQWQEAAPDLARAFDLDPTDYWNAYLLAPLLVETGDRTAYAALCRKCLTQFAGTASPEIATRMTLACALASSQSTDLTAADKLIESALSAPGYTGLAYAIPPKALLELRSGRPGEAAARLQELLAQLATGKLQAGRFVLVEAHTFLAMAHQALGHRQEARAELSRALEVAPAKIATPARGDYGTAWHEWLMLQIHLREAKELIERGG
jgi:serine/threonine-protein kinase